MYLKKLGFKVNPEMKVVKGKDEISKILDGKGLIEYQDYMSRGFIFNTKSAPDYGALLPKTKQ